ncbi:MAG TPA: hypothetical protein DCE41_30960 [Cytophagales bacterium]|nr:hypothetical protein [Cytophagales bacterium]HAA21558.1 hypothetical protein [Cytophagales bacterium]HAP59047.1 hypothetical protein [Cytophagales bacterium]
MTLFFGALTAVFIPQANASFESEASSWPCQWSGGFWPGIQQYECPSNCQGTVITFRSAQLASSYSWSVSPGSTIVSGQGTRTIQVQTPSTGGTFLTLVAGGSTYNTLAVFADCY